MSENTNLEAPDDDDIPPDAFTGEAPKREAKERKGGAGPDGPACPVCKKDERGVVHTWRNVTRNGRGYYRCSKCGGRWWPMRDNMQKIDPATAWPPLDKPKEKQS